MLNSAFLVCVVHVIAATTIVVLFLTLLCSPAKIHRYKGIRS